MTAPAMADFLKIVAREERYRAGRDVMLELLGPGEIFGGVAVIEQRPYPASAQATEPSAIVNEARLAAALLRLAEREGARGPAGITLPFSLTR